jgi:hypothetical protein
VTNDPEDIYFKPYVKPTRSMDQFVQKNEHAPTSPGAFSRMGRKDSTPVMRKATQFRCREDNNNNKKNKDRTKKKEKNNKNNNKKEER